MASYDTSGPPAPRRGMAMASLVLGLLSLPTLGLLGCGALLGIVLGALALVKANRAPQEYGGKGLAIAGIAASAVSFVLAAVIGVIAAIAVPSLLRARISANESSAIGDVRTVISAQFAYQSANNGYFDTPECLANPSACLRDYTGPEFVSASLALASTKSGYRRTFVPGPPAPAEALQQGASPSSLQSFAYLAVPESPGRTGVRAFCGDSSGRLCSTNDGTAPSVVDGMCSLSCETL